MADEQKAIHAPSTEHLLVVEDDERIAANLVRALQSQGYQVTHTSSGARARAVARDEQPDLVLLDLGLPDMDGLDVCRSLVADNPHLRVLALTARADEIDIVLGLDAGAVDYITKPFSLAELLARIRSQLRQRHDDTVSAGRQVIVGSVLLDPPSRRVWVDGNEVDLRAKEFDLLRELMANAGRVVSREDLMSSVWDEHWFGSTKTLDVHIASLRRKLGDTTSDDENMSGMITTLRGIGYRYERNG